MSLCRLLLHLFLATAGAAQCLTPIETSSYGNEGENKFMQYKYLNQGKVISISWGTWNPQQNIPYTLGNVSWNEATSSNIVSHGLNFNACPSFTLQTNDYINGYRVVYSNLYIYGLFFYTFQQKSFQCIHNNIINNINAYTDSGIIHHNKSYLSGFTFYAGSIIDGISLQFTPMHNYCTCCHCIVSKISSGCSEATDICESTICSLYPLCCNNAWNDICSNLADRHCHGNGAAFMPRSPLLTSDWLLIARLNNVSVGTFDADIVNTGNENANNKNANTYSIIGQIGNIIHTLQGPQLYEDDYGRYQFKLIYHNFDGTQYTLLFKQSSWIETTRIEGYVPIDVPAEPNNTLDCARFEGLGLSDYNEDSYIDGNAMGGCWWNSVVTLQTHMDGIPAFMQKIAYHSALYILEYQTFSPTQHPTIRPMIIETNPSQSPNINLVIETVYNEYDTTVEIEDKIEAKSDTNWIIIVLVVVFVVLILFGIFVVVIYMYVSRKGMWQRTANVAANSSTKSKITSSCTMSEKSADNIQHGLVTNTQQKQFVIFDDGTNDAEVIGDDEMITPGNITDINIVANEFESAIAKTYFNVETRRDTNRNKEGYY